MSTVQAALLAGTYDAASSFPISSFCFKFMPRMYTYFHQLPIITSHHTHRVWGNLERLKR
jgi:hypothetical protein